MGEPSDAYAPYRVEVVPCGYRYRELRLYALPARRRTIAIIGGRGLSSWDAPALAVAHLSGTHHAGVTTVSERGGLRIHAPLDSYHSAGVLGRLCMGSAGPRLRGGQLHPVDAVLMSSWMFPPTVDFSRLLSGRVYEEDELVAAWVRNAPHLLADDDAAGEPRLPRVRR